MNSSLHLQKGRPSKDVNCTYGAQHLAAHKSGPAEVIRENDLSAMNRTQ